MFGAATHKRREGGRRKAKAETHLDFDLDRDRPKHGGWADGRTDKSTQSDKRMTRRQTQVQYYPYIKVLKGPAEFVYYIEGLLY